MVFKIIFFVFFWFLMGFYGLMVFRFSYMELKKPENTTAQSASVHCMILL